MARSLPRQRILKAAESLFGSQGVGVTSIRSIIRKAGVNLNALHYHFGSKAEVTREVFEQILEPISRERQALFEKIAPAKPRVRDVLHAMYLPVVRRISGAPHSKAY